MSKILLLLAFVLVIWILAGSVRRMLLRSPLVQAWLQMRQAMEQAAGRGQEEDARRPEPSAASRRLVRCDSCGTHLPEDRALHEGSSPSGPPYYCSEACRATAGRHG